MNNLLQKEQHLCHVADNIVNLVLIYGISNTSVLEIP